MTEKTGLMAGKRGVILGVANNRSIAYGIAKACAAHGAELGFTWQGDALKKRVEPLAAELGGVLLGHPVSRLPPRDPRRPAPGGARAPAHRRGSGGR